MDNGAPFEFVEITPPPGGAGRGGHDRSHCCGNGAGGELGRATSTAPSTAGFTVVAADRNERGLRELPPGIRSGVAETADPAVPAELIGRTPVTSGRLRSS